MKKSIDVCGLGNGLLDIVLEVGDKELSRLGLEKGSERLIDGSTQAALMSFLTGRKPLLTSGGSVANSVIAVSQLGGHSAFLCRLGDDEYGHYYAQEFHELRIEVQGRFESGERTGTVLVLLSSDAERTMRASLGAAARFSEENLDENLIIQSKWLLIEGYAFANSPASRGAIQRAIQMAKAAGTQVAVTISEDFVVHHYGDSLRPALAQADLVFANEKEAMALAGGHDWNEAFDVLKQQLPGIIVTAGGRGARLKIGGCECQVRAFPCEPVDLTGAGDMLAGAFLYGITHELAPQSALSGGCYMAMRVITQYGARLKGNVLNIWEDYLRQA